MAKLKIRAQKKSLERGEENSMDSSLMRHLRSGEFVAAAPEAVVGAGEDPHEHLEQHRVLAHARNHGGVRAAGQASGRKAAQQCRQVAIHSHLM